MFIHENRKRKIEETVAGEELKKQAGVRHPVLPGRMQGDDAENKYKQIIGAPR